MNVSKNKGNEHKIKVFKRHYRSASLKLNEKASPKNAEKLNPVLSKLKNRRRSFASYYRNLDKSVN